MNNTEEPIKEAEELMRIAELSVGPKGAGVSPIFLAKLESIITAHQLSLLETVEKDIIGENATTGKRGTPEYTRKYIVDIQNYLRATQRKALNSIKESLK